MGWAELNRLAATKRLLTYADVDACDIPRSTFDDRTRAEGWPPRPYPGVVPTPGPPLDARERIRAAALSVAGPSCVGGLAALYLHGIIDTPPAQTLLWVPAAHRGTSSRTRRVRRSALLRRGDIVGIDGIPVLRAGWALRDAAADATVDRLRHLAIDARFAGVLGDADLDEVAARDRRFAGRADYLQVADDLRHDGSDSGFEFRTRGRLIAAGMPPDDRQERLWTPGKPRDVDLPYARYQVGVECVGLAFHGRDELDRDAERTNDIASRGDWLILELTYRMQYGAPWERFLDRLGRALRGRGYPGPLTHGRQPGAGDRTVWPGSRPDGSSNRSAG